MSEENSQNILTENQQETQESVMSQNESAIVTTTRPRLKCSNGTISDISIRQPQTVTFGSYSGTSIQEDMLSDIIVQLQENLFYNVGGDKLSNGNESLFVKLEMKNYPSLQRRLSEFKDLIKSLTKWEFEFKWSGQLSRTDEAKNLVDSSENDICTQKDDELIFSGPIFITHAKKSSDPKVVFLEVHHLAVPFLLFCGKGVGYTEYIKSESDSLVSKYSKRLYKMIKTWGTLDRDAVEISLQEFRSMFKLKDTFESKDIRVRILDVAKKELESKNIKFDYEFICKHPVAGVRRQKADTIRFTVLTKPQKHMIDTNSAASRREQVLQMYLENIADKEKRDSCRLYAQDIIDRGGFTNLNNKFRYYRKRLQDGFLTEEKYRNTMLKVVRETYNIELRNPDHARRATIVVSKIKNKKK